jgi:formylglycine-generating enzyme required for sulfatase activity
MYEVTVGRFRTFVEAGAGTAAGPPDEGAGAHPKISGSSWSPTWNQHLPPSSAALRELLGNTTWTEQPGDNEQKPIANVPWLVAFAFCAWDGARLPTYAEWSFAALGGDEQRHYPWSAPGETTINASQAAYDCGFDPPAYTCPPPRCSLGGAVCDQTCLTNGGSCVPQACFGCDAPTDIAPVGSLPPGVGRYGHFELAGNLAELVLDATIANGSPPLNVPCVDCAPLMGANPAGALGGGNDDYKVYVGGGDWRQTGSQLSAAPLATVKWSSRSEVIGFRCARD